MQYYRIFLGSWGKCTFFLIKCSSEIFCGNYNWSKLKSVTIQISSNFMKSIKIKFHCNLGWGCRNKFFSLRKILSSFHMSAFFMHFRTLCASGPALPPAWWEGGCSPVYVPPPWIKSEALFGVLFGAAYGLVIISQLTAKKCAGTPNRRRGEYFFLE